MRKIKIGYSVHILASDSVLAAMVPLLMSASDETGAPIEFSVDAAEEPEVLKAQTATEKLVKEEMDRQGKSWIAQWERANRAEAELKKLRGEPQAA